ncbi:MAG TPA: hypothetical protein VEM36_00360 [Xanthobacteraceae bacterium]|nr:hypothetical protein [Xanthobacteraceae bacterium]
MARSPRRKSKRSVRAAPASRRRAASFASLAAAALERGEPDAIPDELLRQTLAAAVKVYAAKAEQRGELAPFKDGAVTATETVVAACALIRAADLNLFDVAMWFHRAPRTP